MLNVIPVPAFNDNYIWVIQLPESYLCVVVDPGDAEKVQAYLDKKNLALSAILITHPHLDHVGGVAVLLEKYSVPVYGPADISVVTHPVSEGDIVDVLGLSFSVIGVPGHTLNHIAFYGDDKLFCGDALFSSGCGRMFEGTPAMFLASLNKLKSLPPKTKVYCAHEYTGFNLLFAKSIEPNNSDIAVYQKQVKSLRDDGKPTVPTHIGLELKVNPFLRTHVASVQAAAKEFLSLSVPTEIDEVRVFAALREARDNFSG